MNLIEFKGKVASELTVSWASEIEVAADEAEADLVAGEAAEDLEDAVS